MPKQQTPTDHIEGLTKEQFEERFKLLIRIYWDTEKENFMYDANPLCTDDLILKMFRRFAQALENKNSEPQTATNEQESI